MRVREKAQKERAVGKSKQGQVKKRMSKRKSTRVHARATGRATVQAKEGKRKQESKNMRACGRKILSKVFSNVSY